MNHANKLSVVIPTKNRHQDLLNAIDSINNQILLPYELIVIDQSDSPLQIDIFSGLTNNNVTVKYVYDKNITSLVDAKFHSLSYVSGDILCFLEDDIILEREYLFEIAKGFIQNKNLIGSSGVITNYPKSSKIKKILFNIFHIGIYRDPRISIYSKVYTGFSNLLIPSPAISGGLSAWKVEVFKHVLPSRDRNFFMLEDIDFSTRVDKFFPNSLFINPNARLVHLWSPKNRADHKDRFKKKIIESYLFYKIRRSWNYSLTCFIWILVGFFFESLLKSFSLKSISPVITFISTILTIINHE